MEGRACRRQGEVKAINVSELAMHHTSVLIDRWHQETVLFLFNHTHTHARTLSLLEHAKRVLSKEQKEEKVHAQG